MKSFLLQAKISREMPFKLVIILTVWVAAIISSKCLSNNIGVWKSVTMGLIPSGGVLGGYESINTELYICRADNRIGRYHSDYKKCYLKNNDNEIDQTDDLYLLADIGHRVWTPAAKGMMPCNTIAIEGAPPTFVGRVKHKEHILPGPVNNGIIYVTYGNKAFSYSNSFEVLTVVPHSISLKEMESSFIYETNGKYLSFKVKSEKEVFIDFGGSNETMFRVAIGALSNRMTSIGTISDPLKTLVQTEGILDSNNTKGFWVRWIESNTLEFGVENQVDALLKLVDSQIMTINSVVFNSKHSKSEWQTADLLPRHPQFISLSKMESSNAYGTNGNYLPFKVKSEKEVFLNFGYNNETMFRVTIGALSNRMSSIGTISNPLRVFVQTTDILDSANFKGFWVRWIQTNTLEFGVDGKSEPLLKLVDVSINTINFVVFNSKDSKSEWEIGDLPKLLITTVEDGQFTRSAEC